MELFSPELERLAAARSAIMIEQLETLNAYLPGGEWSVDLETCVFQMGAAQLRCGLIGSFAGHDNSFLWSWGNPGYGLDHAATQPVLRLTDIGRIWEIPELTENRLDLSTQDDPVMCAERLVMAATALLECRGYLGLPYEGGKFYVAFNDDRVPTGRFDPVSASRRLTHGIGVFPADHRLTVTRYLEHHGIVYREVPEGLLADLGSGASALAMFTADGRFGGWQSSVTAAA
ncbi:DUF6882 domain-containing protein [Longispora albida]|uniref:DUF6882 domain-containing protein n=1 Tax=Longispora albida TaxID=203523 RepID=UPI00035E7001|nr:DUF6882 domain-containing protein [Longispora albida]